jgi:hypothetical protein
MSALTRPARLLFQEDLGQTEAPACQITSIVVADQRETFFAHFAKENFPRLLRNLLKIKRHARCLLRLRLGLRGTRSLRRRGRRFRNGRLRTRALRFSVMGSDVRSTLFLPAALALSTLGAGFALDRFRLGPRGAMPPLFAFFPLFARGRFVAGWRFFANWRGRRRGGSFRDSGGLDRLRFGCGFRSHLLRDLLGTRVGNTTGGFDRHRRFSRGGFSRDGSGVFAHE